jgi:hypothetical protein
MSIKLLWSRSFFGTLYNTEKANCEHQSNVLHNVDIYPETNYNLEYKD